MDSKTYLESSARTDLTEQGYYNKAAFETNSYEIKLFHAALGMAGEVGDSEVTR